MKTNEKNVFFDINKLPADKGHIVIGLSMSRLETGQSPSDVMDFLNHVSPNKITKPLVGCNFLYTDTLYLRSDEPAHVLKSRYTALMTKHKNGLLNLLQKNWKDFQIQESFSFLTWNHLYVGYNNFYNDLLRLRQVYEKDENFKKYLLLDCKDFNREPTENQIMFFLEEHLAIYYITRGIVKIPNDFIQNEERWILFAYKGRPPRHYIYLQQKNLLGKIRGQKDHEFKTCFYNWEKKELIDCLNVDLERYILE